MKDYIKIARPDHWIKNLFIFPGTLFALLLVGWKGSYGGLAGIALVSFFCTCMIASANYVINEWLDARFDKYHPTKKKRPVVQNTMSGKIVAAEYAVLAAVGLGASLLVNIPFFVCELWLLVMGVLYNVKPFRTKDIAYLQADIAYGYVHQQCHPPAAGLVFRNGGLSAAGHHRAGLLAGRRVSHGHQALCRIPYDR